MLDGAKLFAQPKFLDTSYNSSIRKSEIKNSTLLKSSMARQTRLTTRQTGGDPLKETLQNKTEDGSENVKYVEVPGAARDTEAPLGEQPADDGPKPNFFVRICNNYNRSFLFALGLQYFNTGMAQSMISMAIMYLFLNKYKLSPGKTN